VADLDGLIVPGEAVSLNLSCEHLAQAERVYSLLTHSPPTHCLLTYCLLTYCLLTLLTYLAQAERVYYSGRNPGAYAFGKEMVRAIRGLTPTPTLPLTLTLTITLALI
jgi:hypothetical protein